MSDELGYKPFDCDNHYYEAEDAFTRHVLKNMRARCVQWAEIEGRKRHIVGGKVSYAVTNPTWDPIAKPGSISDFLRGNPNKLKPEELLSDPEPLPDCYINRDARIKTLDEQGLDAMWLFPTLGVLYEELLKHDIEAVPNFGPSTAGSTKTGAATTRTAFSVRPISPWPTSILPAKNWNGRSRKAREPCACARPRSGPLTAPCRPPTPNLTPSGRG